MLGIGGDAEVKTFEREEQEEPSLRKIEGDCIIFATGDVDIPENPTHAVLCDFGDAQFGEETYIGEVMPDIYRAPGIVLGIPWNEKIDIWSVGLMVTYKIQNYRSTATLILSKNLGLIRGKAYVHRTTT